ncbi:Ribosomal protein L33 family protein [Cinnamomum micranthum f. kanehirae]|uniref:Ribosomal protein L33 family protein n=1 Tax=Cinnamomum micranthum f. kanehirae TaxID=337451 RepID=A0A3S3R352_9MAGN|nr:Ribosomal protein L33 family protein [Cinnamomum micranthum f. kanehirae]
MYLAFCKLKAPGFTVQHVTVIMGKREKTYLFVRLVSAAGTGFFYVARKSRKGNMAQQKLEFRKYDPRVNRHVLFTEAKMK